MVVYSLEHEYVRAVAAVHVRREGNRTGKLVLGRVVCGVVHELNADAGVEAVELGGEVVDIIRA